MMRDRIDDWNDEYQQQFMTTYEVRAMVDNINETLEDEFQIWLEEAIAPQQGNEIRTDILRDLVSDIHRKGHSKVSYAALGETLYFLAHDALTDYMDYNQALLERE
jgi:hypothetical protein